MKVEQSSNLRVEWTLEMGEEQSLEMGVEQSLEMGAEQSSDSKSRVEFWPRGGVGSGTVEVWDGASPDIIPQIQAGTWASPWSNN